MDEVIVLSFSDESEEDSPTSRRRQRMPAQDVIDLTGDGEVFSYFSSSDDVIDLTGHEEDSSHGFLQNAISDSPCTSSSLSEHGRSDLGREEVNSSSMTKSRNRESWDSDNESSACSSMCSSKSMRSGLPYDDLPESMDADLPLTSSTNHTTVNSSHLQDSAETNTQVQPVKSSIPAPFVAMLEAAGGASDCESDLVNKSPLHYEEASKSKSDLVNKSLLYKLRYFKKPPVTHHFFPHKNSQPAPVPLTRVNLVNSTIEESFHPGTLYFLSEFVSEAHYPPRDLISHVINSILLGAEEQTIRREAYEILMKVQRLHPATSESVAWQWNLLSDVMTSKQEYQSVELFLQYVAQTLDDDFHLCLQRRALHKSLCKLMLSCDKTFCNVKQVIDWLIDVVNRISETGQEDPSQCNLQRTVFLLQRMVSIAVDVDNSPTMSSNKMSEYIFPHVLVLKTRQQRELFFSSTGNVLLRAKILELIFLHSCTIPPTPQVSLSFDEIIYFIRNSTLQLENQGPEWQKWDEILHHLTVLCLSLQTIITDHLRTPVTDRTDDILKRLQSRLVLSGGITESEVDHSLTIFKQRTCLGAEPPAAILSRLFLLRSLLCTAVKRYS